MRLVRISLATKYRILFGLAVLLIIAAALSFPWFYVEAMVQEPPFREAKRAADDYFQHVLALPDAQPPAAHEDLYSDERQTTGRPRFVRYTFDADDPHSMLVAGPEDPFIARSLIDFARRHDRDTRYRLIEDEDEDEDGNKGTLRFHYARAVRVTKSCLTCHSEGSAGRPFRENQLAGIITLSLPAERMRRALVFNRAVLIAAGALAGILAILVFYLITQRYILSPIHELRSVAMRVADGDLGVRSTLETGDEFEQLSDTLNVMLERLRIQQDELRNANRLLDEKLGQMAESNVALYEANRIKSDFLANVSHELRTPLTSIIGFAELLRESPPDERAKVERFSENILISGRILLEIINDLLDLAKIEAGKVELHIEPVDIGELCATLIDFTRPLADQKMLRHEFRVQGTLPTPTTDRGKLRQILFNLLSNAIKFTPTHGRVVMTAEPGPDGGVRIAVQDNGPGIASEAQQMIFEKFRQMDQSKTREQGGTGLGLAIARELTTMLGGEIGVISAPNEGATFWVTLPASAPRESERPAVSLV